VTLPLPEVQIFGGGAHAGRRVDVQDFMVMPVGAWTFGDAIAIVAEVYRAAGALMQEPARPAASPTRAAGGPTSRATRKR
jgi:enolase